MEAGWDGTGVGKKNGGYSATFEDVLSMCGEDWRLILCAFVALLLAALSQVGREGGGGGGGWGMCSLFFCLRWTAVFCSVVRAGDKQVLLVGVLALFLWVDISCVSCLVVDQSHDRGGVPR